MPWYRIWEHFTLILTAMGFIIVSPSTEQRTAVL